MTTVFFAAGAQAWNHYEPRLPQALAEAGVGARIVTEAADPAQVDYIIFAPGGVIEDFGPFTNTRAVLNLWAGVERIIGNPTLTQPLCRMVDPGLETGMIEYVTAHALRHHLGMDRYIKADRPHWDVAQPPLAKDRKVAVLGLGQLGSACAKALARTGFDVRGWSRTPRDVDGITCFSGPEGLDAALSGAEIVVLLLPDTPATENTLNARTLALLAKGAAIINPGRGPLIDEAALLDALDSGQVGHATMDVFRQEPLPQDHPFWDQPNVTVTPHIAAWTRPDTAAAVLAENIRRGEAGEPFLHLVDRVTGY